eukprot:TRINITY_DN346_c3_g1_i1.p1 TRINITY_DN346_c3_g1~~TRINITY_DN346_c3_g1_i1.p1  ORF type:complete len:569 (-),score=94.20 TRINITY_DN346_c3_g1_i1:209-1915(-)
MAGFYGEVDTSPAGFGQGNTGFSGTPLWKLKQHGLVAKPTLKEKSEAEQEKEKERHLEELQVAKVLMDSATMGGPADAPTEAKTTPKPFVRHVSVRDLRKVATRTKFALPTTGLFSNHVPIALFALFDGQSSSDAQAPGPHAAEWCCRHVHTKLIKNLVSLPPDQVNQTFLKATLIKTFEDLDRDLLAVQPAIHDGCGAASALLVGDLLFTAVVGRCDVVLCEAQVQNVSPGESPMARSFGSRQGRCHLLEERKWLESLGGQVFEDKDGRHHARGPAGIASVSRSLGDRQWKVPFAGVAEGTATFVRCVPEVSVVRLTYADGFPAMFLTSATVSDALPVHLFAEVSAEFANKPRSASGEVIGRAALAVEPDRPDAPLRQFAAVTVILLQPKTFQDDTPSAASRTPSATASSTSEPAAKRQKKDEVQSVRLRHILVRHRESAQPMDPVRNKPVTRPQARAEALLRGALRELLREQNEIKGKARPGTDPKKAALASLQPTPKFVALSKELSECQTASKGGGMCGDLGWLQSAEIRTFGEAFADCAKNLGVGQWSDIVTSQHGVHLLQRIA